MNRSRFALTALAAMLLAGPAFAVDITPKDSTSTRLSVSGFIQAYGTYYFDASQGPTGEIGTDDRTAPSNNFVDTIRTSRMTFSTITPNTELGDISTTFEFDLCGPNNSTGFRTRQAYGQWGNFTLGQTWSNWVDGDAAADEVDWNGPIGQASYDVPRVPLAAYKFVLDKQNSIILSLEHNSGAGDGANNNGPTATIAPDAKYPNLVGVYQYYDKWGHIALRALAQSYGVYDTTGAGKGVHTNKWGTAIQLSGQLNCFGLDVERDSLVYNVYTGSALGLYGFGAQATQYDPATRSINMYKNTGWTVGYTHTWNMKYRSNLVLSGINYSTNNDIVTQTGDVKSILTAQVNTFVKLTKTAELGFEWMHEELKTVNANDVLKADGTTGNKNTSDKFEIELKYTF